MRARDDDGITLIEVIVYLVISGMFLALLAGLFVAGLRAQTTATDLDSATGASGVVSSSLQSGIRNAAAFALSDDNQTVVATVIADDGPSCRGWRVTADGDLLYQRSSSAIPLTGGSGWTAIAHGVVGSLSRVDGTDADGAPKIVPIDADGDGRTDAFARTGTLLQVGMDIKVGDGTVAWTTGITARAVGEGVTTTCW
ncbi:prepilin-type N-terminal cleavage/methylation domain-containing protein [Microbacterium suwonense]|uniref:type IV pilus modification PilV family protein n=1 Tax=Microbacterium suwonense TaxID=683047 RepID=UPI00360FFB19